MKFRIYALVVVFLWLAGLPNISSAQISTVPNNQKEKSQSWFNKRFDWVKPHTPNINEFNFIGGYSFHSTRGFWGKIPEATLSIFTLRFNRKLLTFEQRHLIEYVTELNVAANYTVNHSSRYPKSSFTGFGITPIGFQFNFGQKHIVQPFFKSSAGFMYFSKRFPDQRGTKFNFTLELGGGLEFVIAQNLSLTVGYKYHHMSNGEFGQINPGVDSNIFYTGFTFF